MPLTFPAPSLRLRQCFDLAQQIYSSIRELQELADGEPAMEEELDQLHSSFNVLIATLNQELSDWQQLALTAARQTSEIVRFDKAPDALLAGFLEGSISVRVGDQQAPITKEQVFKIDAWMPVHRGETQ